MTAPLSFIVAIIVVINLDYLCAGNGILMCYYHSYARHRTNIAKFEIKHIDFTLCTHYIYGHACVDNVTKHIVSKEPSDEEGDSGLYRQFVDGKKISSSIKTLLSVGGKCALANAIFESLGSNTTHAETFATSAVAFLTQHNFDGLEFDWDFPYKPQNKKQVSTILKALRREFNKLSRTRFSLTATGQGWAGFMSQAYDVVDMANYLDYVIIRTDRMHYYVPVTYAHFNSPLFPRTTFNIFSSLCVNHSIHSWKNAGMPYGKIVVGISGLGRVLELVDGSQSEPGSNVTNTVKYGPLYNMSSELAYPEVCVLRNSSLRLLDPVQLSPYLVRGSTWIGYEDKESIAIKLEWMKKLNVAGMMFAALDEDDFTGTVCDEGMYPLLSYMKNFGNPPNMSSVTTAAEEMNTGTTVHEYMTTVHKYSPITKRSSGSVVIYLLWLVLFILGCIFGHVSNVCLKRRNKRTVSTE